MVTQALIVLEESRGSPFFQSVKQLIRIKKKLKALILLHISGVVMLLEKNILDAASVAIYRQGHSSKPLNGVTLRQPLILVGKEKSL